MKVKRIKICLHVICQEVGVSNTSAYYIRSSCRISLSTS